ncbi:MAG: hypothetical protein LBC45_06285 [Chlamydiales bacterium]|jgi:hypothetical protein|nr:hypothetical protein [Chlamydiales bacterium]
MSQSIKRFLKPSYYILEEDRQLTASVQRISDCKREGGLNGHILALVQAVHSIALALFMNTPYFLALGCKHVFLNCVQLNLQHMVLGHYKSAMQNLIYTVIATMYVAIGIFIPSVLHGFKMEDHRSDDLFSSDSSIMQSREEHEEISSSSISDPSTLDRLLVSNDWLVVSNAESFAIESTHIRTRDMMGTNGVNLERQAYRTALNEYARILKDDFDIDVKKRLVLVANWLKSPVYKNNPIIHALYRTLFYLTRPVAYNGKDPIYTHAKEQYEEYVTSLRDVLAMTKYQEDLEISRLEEMKECFTLIRALCEARFRSENHGLLRSLLQLHEDEYDRLNPERKEIPSVTRENFVQMVVRKNKKVTKAPDSMKISSLQRNSRMACGAVGWEDFLMTDIPFLRGKQIFVNNQGEERSFYYMRHPTPHIAGSLSRIVSGAMSRLTGLGHIESGEVIAPEFEGMLEAIAERKESYLIQSHQRLNDEGFLENENSRSQTLYRLQERYKNFHVVFQAVEGDLFDRLGSYAQITTFAGLKEAIRASFDYEKRNTSPNRLPAYLEKDEEYRGVIDRLLNQVHQILFGGRVAISFAGQDVTKPGIRYSNREWQAFILAFYILQGDDLKFRLPDVKYFCTNCKNFFDRGGNRAMAEDRLHQEMSEKEVTSEDLRATIANLIPVPLQSKGRAVIEKRLKPGLALAEILATLSLEDRRGLQRIHFEGYRPDRFEVSKKEQRAVPLMEDVCTLQEMQEVLRALQRTSYRIVDNSMIQHNWNPYRGIDRNHLFNQVNKDLKRFEVCINEILYNAQDSSTDAEGIFALLVHCGISEEVALQTMAQIQQSILLEPFSGLMKAFQHDMLGLHITDSPEKSTIDVGITEDCIEIKAQNKLLYKTTILESSYFRENPIAIFITKVLVTISKDGSDSNGHWTWEVTEVPD